MYTAYFYNFGTNIHGAFIQTDKTAKTEEVKDIKKFLSTYSDPYTLTKEQEIDRHLNELLNKKECSIVGGSYFIIIKRN